MKQRQQGQDWVWHHQPARGKTMMLSSCYFSSCVRQMSIVTVRESVFAVIQYVPLVIQGAQTRFIHFHRIYNVVCRVKHAEFCVGGSGQIYKHVYKTLVLNVFFDVSFLNAFAFFAICFRKRDCCVHAQWVRWHENTGQSSCSGPAWDLLVCSVTNRIDNKRG